MAFYKWTQWIFLQVYNAWYDEEAARARHVDELAAAFASAKRALPDGLVWSRPGRCPATSHHIDGHRLAYLTASPVNWCPGLGTVLSNEEVTADGRSDRGNFPVFKRNLRQWSMRITSYADRLLADLDGLDWP